MKSPESVPKFSVSQRFTLFSKSENPLNVWQKSTIHVLFQAKSVDRRTYSPLPHAFDLGNVGRYKITPMSARQGLKDAHNGKKNICQLSWIIQESPRYRTNLPVYGSLNLPDMKENPENTSFYPCFGRQF